MILSYNVLLGQVRYIDDLPGNVVQKNEPYLEMPISQCWKNGNKPSVNQLIKNDDPYKYNPSPIAALVPGSTINNKCFNYHEYSSVNETYRPEDTSFMMHYRKFELDNDPEPCRKAIIYIGGGQGTLDAPVSGSGVRYFDQLITNPTDYYGIKVQDVNICKYLAQKGYAVFYLDLRDGWDIKGISNVQSTPGFENYWYTKYCDCEDSCDVYSLIDGYYRNVQDLLALHGYLVKHWDSLNINPNEVSYFGNSSGSVIAMQATFGRDDFPFMQVSATRNGGGSLVNIEQKLGSLLKFAPPGILDSQLTVDKMYLLSAGIFDTTWIEASDSVYFRNYEKFPIYIQQGTSDDVIYVCGGIGRGFKYQGEFNPLMFTFGGGNIHDRILNIGMRSHLITFKGFEHGGVMIFSRIKCFNPTYSDACFTEGTVDESFGVKTKFTLDYMLINKDKFIHAIVLANRLREDYNGENCNLCHYELIADNDSARQKMFSCCTQDCDQLFSAAYYRNNEWDTVLSVNSGKQVYAFPTVTKNFSMVSMDPLWLGKQVSIRIVDSNGRPFYENDIIDLDKYWPCDLSSFPNGLYFVLIYEGGLLLGSTKIIKG